MIKGFVDDTEKVGPRDRPVKLGVFSILDDFQIGEDNVDEIIIDYDLKWKRLIRST